MSLFNFKVNFSLEQFRLSRGSSNMSKKATKQVGIHEMIMKRVPLSTIKHSHRKLLNDMQIMNFWRDPNLGYNFLTFSCINENNEFVEYLLDEKRGSLWSNADIVKTIEICCELGIGISLPILLDQLSKRRCHSLLPHQYSLYSSLVDQNKLTCANALLNHILAKHDVAGNYLLHKVCIHGKQSHLAQLLATKRYQKEINLKNSQGFTAVQIASFWWRDECVQLLLNHGANAQFKQSHCSCLHLMFLNDHQVPLEHGVRCMRLLLNAGVKLNDPDHNNNTVLDYVVHEVVRNAGGSADDSYYRDILKIYHFILEQGASLKVNKENGSVDHTSLQTALQAVNNVYTYKPYRFADNTLHILECMLYHGANANHTSISLPVSPFVYLLTITLRRMPRDKCIEFVQLFLCHGAELDLIVCKPPSLGPDLPDIRWGVYPVMLALDANLPFSIIQLLHDLMGHMTLRHSFVLTKTKRLFQALRWSPMTQQATQEKHQYQAQYQHLSKSVLQDRTLRHYCKIVVLKSLGRNYANIAYLPLPPLLKSYLKSFEDF